MLTIARAMALIGGLVLTALIVLVCVSVLGRGLNSLLQGPVGSLAPDFAAKMLALGVGPVNGDFEIVEAGIAFAIFAFLPLCQITSGHATVDIFTARLPAGLRRFLAALIECVFAIVLVVIALKLYEGMESKRRYGETTFLLQFPIWWSYAASLFAAVIAAIMGIYMAAMRLLELFMMRPLIPLDTDVSEADS